jgi:hypothetical protein
MGAEAMGAVVTVAVVFTEEAASTAGVFTASTAGVFAPVDLTVAAFMLFAALRG